MGKKLSLIKDFLVQFWNERSFEDKIELDEIFSRSLIINSPIGKTIGSNQFMKINGKWLTAFPDLKLSNIAVEQYGNCVVTSWNSQATHLSPFKEFEASKKCVNYSGETTFFFKENKVVRYSCKIDMLDIYNQLGFKLAEERYERQTVLRKDRNLLIEELKNKTKVRLTNREVEMLAFYLTGFSSKQIASICFISYRTVETHISNGIHEFGCHTKKQCLEKIVSLSLLPVLQDLAVILLEKYERKK